jgi:hypothetical protein
LSSSDRWRDSERPWGIALGARARGNHLGSSPAAVTQGVNRTERRLTDLDKRHGPSPNAQEASRIPVREGAPVAPNGTSGVPSTRAFGDACSSAPPTMFEDTPRSPRVVMTIRFVHGR